MSLTRATSGEDPSYEQVLDAALKHLDEGREPDRSGLLAEFPAAEPLIAKVLGAIARYKAFARDDRERRLAGRRPDLLARGAELGDYRIIGLLGQGGMGIVYRARQRSLGEREVALKVLRATLVAQDPRFLERFKREAALASLVHDEHVAEVYAYGEHEGQPYFTMQLIEGRSLSEVLKGLARRQSEGWSDHTRADFVRQVVRLVRDLASGLAAIHAAGFVHRDIKPSNVILAGAGVDDLDALNAAPVLVDFGLVRKTESSNLTGSLTRLGSPAYSSPEGMLGHEQDARSDVFSLGALLHDLLCLTGAGTRGPASSGLHSVRAVNAGVDERLEAIVCMSLEERRELRYEDGAALRDELDRYLQRDPIRALPTSRLGRLRLWGRRDPLRAVKLFASAGALTTLVFFVVWGGSRALPLYAATSAAIAAERRGDLATASTNYAELHAGRELAAWLPGLSDDLARAAEYRDEGGLSILFDWLASSSESDWTLAHNELQRRLLEPGADSDLPRLMRFLVRELELGDEGRQLRAATTVGQYLLVFPLPFGEDAAREPWARSLEAALLSVLDSVDPQELDSELRYYTICALSGLGSLEPFRCLIPLIAHPDPETRRLATSATERLWLSSWEEGEPRGFPLALLCEWIEVLWTSGEDYDVALYEGRFSGGRQGALERVVHRRFELSVVASLHTVVWALRGEELGPQVEIAHEWQALPRELRDHMRRGGQALKDYLREGTIPDKEEREQSPPVWPRSGVPASAGLHYDRLIRYPETTSRQLPMAAQECVSYSNLWGPSAQGSRIHLTHEPSRDASTEARFLFLCSPPVIEGRALEFRAALSYLRPNDRTDPNPPPGAGYLLVLSRPVKDQLQLRVQVPEGAVRAFVTIDGTPAIRGPLPHQGSSNLILSAKDGSFTTECSVLAVSDQPVEILLNERVLLGKNELDLELGLVSTTNQFWLRKVIVRFEVDEQD